MQLQTLLVAALAAVAIASPGSPRPKKCEPATYACARNPGTKKHGWKVCDVMGDWQYAGDCPPKTKCHFNEVNQSPYCI